MWNNKPFIMVWILDTKIHRLMLKKKLMLNHHVVVICYQKAKGSSLFDFIDNPGKASLIPVFRLSSLNLTV